MAMTVCVAISSSDRISDSQCDNKNAAGLCDNQQNWCKQEPGQEISMIFHVCMLLVRGVCPPSPAHALIYG